MSLIQYMTILVENFVNELSRFCVAFYILFPYKMKNKICWSTVSITPTVAENNTPFILSRHFDVMQEVYPLCSKRLNLPWSFRITDYCSKNHLETDRQNTELVVIGEWWNERIHQTRFQTRTLRLKHLQLQWNVTVYMHFSFVYPVSRGSRLLWLL